MKQAIVIGAYEGNAPFLDDLLTSLEGCQYPLVVVVSGSGMASLEWLSALEDRVYRMGGEVHANVEDLYELGAFRRILDDTEIERFLFLQDTFEVLDQKFLDDLFLAPAGVSYALGPSFFHYAGTWSRSILQQMLPLPSVRSKKESVHQEHTFSRRYIELAPMGSVHVYDPRFHDGEHEGFVDRHGRLNMLLENRWYRKWKADWGQRPL